MAIDVRNRKILWSKSANRCNFKNCRKELCLESSSQGHSIIGEECHIVAKSKNGPRGNSSLTSKERDTYENLILLCSNHHTEIDGNEKEYSVDKLKKMKKDHEKWVENKLDEEFEEIDFYFDEDEDILFEDTYIKEVEKWILENTSYENIKEKDIKKSIRELSFLDRKSRKMLVRLINYSSKHGEIKIPSIYQKLTNDNTCDEVEFFESIRMLEKYNYIEFDERFELLEDCEGNAIILQGESIAKYTYKKCWLGDKGIALDAIRKFLDDKNEYKNLVIDLSVDILRE